MSHSVTSKKDLYYWSLKHRAPVPVAVDVSFGAKTC